MNDDDPNLHLAGLLHTLHHMREQLTTYERTLPTDNFQARVIVATLSGLVQQALNEAQELEVIATHDETRPHPFTPREHQVLTLVSKGLTNKEIAYRLGITQRTIEFHLNHIFQKTNTTSRTEASTLAIKNNWL